MKKLLLTMAVGILVLATMALSFADAAFSPADIFAKLKGITTEEAYDLRLETGKSFGTLAEEAGFYDAFKAATLDAKKAILDDLVAKGELTQEEADEIYANLEACDGTQQHMYRGIFGTADGRSGEGRYASGSCDGSGLGAGTGKGMMGQGSGSGRGMMGQGGRGR